MKENYFFKNGLRGLIIFFCFILSSLYISQPKISSAANMAVNEVVDEVMMWWDALDGKKFDTYMNFYSEDLKSGELDHNRFKEIISAVFAKNEGLSVMISDFKIDINDDGTATADLIQSYSAGELSNTEHKVLIWKKDESEGRWKIISETWETGFIYGEKIPEKNAVIIETPEPAKEDPVIVEAVKEEVEVAPSQALSEMSEAVENEPAEPEVPESGPVMAETKPSKIEKESSENESEQHVDDIVSQIKSIQNMMSINKLVKNIEKHISAMKSAEEPLPLSDIEGVGSQVASLINMVETLNDKNIFAKFDASIKNMIEDIETLKVITEIDNQIKNIEKSVAVMEGKADDETLTLAEIDAVENRIAPIYKIGESLRDKPVYSKLDGRIKTVSEALGNLKETISTNKEIENINRQINVLQKMVASLKAKDIYNEFGQEIEGIEKNILILERKRDAAMERLSKKIGKKLAIKEDDKEKKKSTERAEPKVKKRKKRVLTGDIETSFNIEMITSAENIDMAGVYLADSETVNKFFTSYTSGGYNQGMLSQIQDRMASDPKRAAEKRTVEKNFVPSEKININVNSQLSDKVGFSGKLTAFKSWGDPRIKFENQDMGGVRLDADNPDNTKSDIINFKSAYLNYKLDMPEQTKVNVDVAVGRRPFHDKNGRNNFPLAGLINHQFDGVAIDVDIYKLLPIIDDLGDLRIPGRLQISYGSGFNDSQTAYYPLVNSPYMEDVDIFQLMSIFYDDYDEPKTSLSFAYTYFSNLTDGFTGLTIMPYKVTKENDGTYFFDKNVGGYVNSVEPTTNIGSYSLTSALFNTNLKKSTGKDIDFFLGLSWSHAKPSATSQNPFYEVMGMGLLNSDGELRVRDGNSLYLGARITLDDDSQIGLEYNQGSKYWLLTGSEASFIENKLAARGKVYEAYYIRPVIKNSGNFFGKIGLVHYDYEYSGSGNPLGEPVKISEEMESLDTINGAVDEVLDIYASFIMKF